MTRTLWRPSLMLALAGLFIIGLLLGRHVFPAAVPQQGLDLREGVQSEYRHINPLLSCADLESPLPSKVHDMEQEMTKYIDSQKAAGTVAQVSVYFRDLSNGPWFGIHGEETFSPSSLLKVPLMMSLFRKAETDPSVLAVPIVYENASPQVTQLIAPRKKLTYGSTYPAAELLETMITTSDNSAAVLLYRTLGQEQVAQTYTDLGLDSPDPRKDYSIQVHEYASFFRLLYNATYLSPENSERSLALLTRTEYRDGIVAGIPEDIDVAHKFGEREVQGMDQLHDCGIVYVPGRPYILCVMTRGPDLDRLPAVLQTVSSIAYRYQKE